MNRSHLRYVRRCSIASVFLVLFGIYFLHISPAFPGPNSVEVPSIQARMHVIVSIFLFAGACSIMAGALVRLFEPSALRLGTPEHIGDCALAVFGIAIIVAIIYGAVYLLIPITVVWPWFVAIIVVGSSALAVAQWAHTHRQAYRSW